MLCQRKRIAVTEDKLDTFLQELHEVGLTVRDPVFLPLDGGPSILHMGPMAPRTEILISKLAVLRTLEERGLRVGSDVRVTIMGEIPSAAQLRSFASATWDQHVLVDLDAFGLALLTALRLAGSPLGSLLGVTNRMLDAAAEWRTEAHVRQCSPQVRMLALRLSADDMKILDCLRSYPIDFEKLLGTEAFAIVASGWKVPLEHFTHARLFRQGYPMESVFSSSVLE
jgi:hypothetical protein